MVTLLRVAGMTCQGCVKHVGNALRDVTGVTAVEVDLANGGAKVVHDPAVPTAELVAAIDAAGYVAQVA